jgi:hypothetical protein
MANNEFNVDIEKIKSEWHPTKNGDLNFTDLATGSTKPVWWLGACCHEWESKMFLRAVRGAGCLICSNRLLLTGFNDIATKHPDWVPFWSPSNALPCDQVIAGGATEYAWLCELGHEFFSSVGHKERGRGCPYCSNMKLLPGFNDLQTIAPDVAASWNLRKNGELTPETVIAGGRSKYWWSCSLGHEWETTIRKRIDGHGCTVCAGQKVVIGFNDLASQEPAIAGEWHPTKNGDLTPDAVMVRSTYAAWWQCKNGHEWETKISNRTLQNNGCNECKKTTRSSVEKELNLTITHPELAMQWHPVKNGMITPHHVTKGSHKKVWWSGECRHEWEAQVYARAEGNNCPVCAGLKVVVGINDLITTHPMLASQWHPTQNNELTAEQVTTGSNKKVWWLGECGHEWDAWVYHRTAGKGCPVCSGHKVSNGINDLLTIEPALAAEWHPTKNGDLTPEKVTGKGGRVRAWWKCEKGHEWEASVRGRLRGRGCSQCWATSYISKAEQAINDYICSLDANMKVIQSDKKLLKGKELDIYIPEKKVAIEFNGLYWHSEEAGKDKTYHLNKWQICKDNDVQLIQIWEDEWNRNPEQVKRMIAHKLGFSNQQKVFARKTTVVTVPKAKAAKFLNENHVQGYASGTYYVGLIEKGGDIETDDILALLVLKNEAGTEGKTLNIIRYATSANVVGGFTKLLSYAEKTYKPESFITFADHGVSDGGLYENNGFSADKILPPDYMYVVDGERKHKFGYRLKRFESDPELEWEAGLTERQLAKLNGLERIWDSGKTRYRKIVPPES